MKKIFNLILLVVVFLLCFSSLNVFAENINVNLNTININVNNEKVTGNNILYNDRTYVPLRVISEMLSKEVVWTQETSSIDINDVSGMLFKGNIIGNAGKLKIYSDEYTLFEEIVKANNKAQIEEGTLKEEDIKSLIYNEILKFKASYILLEENNLSLPEDFSSQFDESFKMTNEYYASQGLSENAFLEILQFMGYSYDSYKLENQLNKIFSLLSSHFTKDFSEEEKKAYYESNIDSFKKDMVQAKHILLMTEGKTEEETAKIKKKADEILKKLKSGEDFDALMNEYCEDPGVKSNPEGYLFGKGEMVEEFEEAAFALKNKGDLSEVIKTSYGYHIIKLVDKFDTIPYDDSSCQSAIKSSLQKNYVNSLIDEKAKSIDFSIDDSLIKTEGSSTADDEIFNPGEALIDASLNSVKIYVNGKEVDAENIVYNGRTYVPLRKISEMLSKEVVWTEDSKTADIFDTYGVLFSSEEDEINTYKSIAKAENNELSEEELVKIATEKMNFDRNLLSLAASLNIKSDKTILDEYNSYISSLKSQLSQTGNGEEAYKNMLDAMGYTEKAIKRIFEIDYYNSKIFSFLYEELKPSDEEIKKYYEENKEFFKFDGIRVKHILLYTIDDYGNPLEDDEIEAKKKLASSLYEKAKKGEDFDALINEYSEDETISDFPDGYTIQKGDMIEEFEDAAFSIKNVGDVCKPFLSKYGYHIIKLEEKIPYYTLDDEEIYLFVEENMARENLTLKIKNFK